MDAAQLVAPVFSVLPLGQAMSALVPASMSPQLGAGQYENAFEDAYAAVAHLDLADHPALAAAMWLYVDDLDRSHSISQGIHTPLGSYLHGVMHRREGDFSNAKYWFRQASGVSTGIEPFKFVDAVAAARGTNPPELVEMQRQEWQAVFELAAKDSNVL